MTVESPVGTGTKNKNICILPAISAITSGGIWSLKSLRDIFAKLQRGLIRTGICERAANLFSIQAGKDLHTKHVRAGPGYAEMLE